MEIIDIVHVVKKQSLSLNFIQEEIRRVHQYIVNHVHLIKLQKDSVN